MRGANWHNGLGDYLGWVVELLDVCGLSHTAKNWGSVCERQIVKHNLIDNIDYTSHTDVGRSRSLTFTLNAANHILLAAMTDKGKAARAD